ncbi:MAG TPA: helix-turn-helix transcriptional regulator [Solirubrobacterales bacterium]|nr:helix-turn-helix transcriptional regulator [Solirubrobacterales bacterium]
MRRNEDVTRIFGENLKRCRRLMDMSQDELAIRASVHRTEISMLERFLREPRLGTVVRLQNSLEATPEELLKNIVWTPGSVRYGSFQTIGPEVRQ